MSKSIESILILIASHIPDKALAPVRYYLEKYNIVVKLTRNRISKLGDYTPPQKKNGHAISINATLNKYSFLITLIHEIAHAISWERYGNRPKAHGKEWKDIYATILKYFLKKDIFPEDITKALTKHAANPPSSSSLDESLSKVLRKYDRKSERLIFVSELLPGDMFRTPKGKEFVVQEKLRKRFKCKELHSRSIYLFSPVAEVYPLSK